MPSLFADQNQRLEVLKKSINYPSWTLNDRQINDLELLMNGAFSPLTGFMTQDNYESVVRTMRLDDGQLFPMPITLDVTNDFAESIADISQVALRDPEGLIIAILEV